MINIAIGLYIFASLTSLVSASLFDFINHQFGHQQQQQDPLDYENSVLNAACDKFVCPETSICVDEPKFCPCPFPSSQLRCFLPNGQHICISKPAGEISANYRDPKTNWKIDAKDDDIRDCGWVNRAVKGLV
ncbi:uncharacterized protein PRCAT00006234001 [Priceomyces carsonii]|uniref:uncharacterized protein n=1 Tax=Priceomyces carsonii TaxID=28549 RepID=UPI002EDA6E7A|nr:unnamed protein product [Priceomyces carsonii]